MNNLTFRHLARLIHFIMAALLGTYVYSPWSSNPNFSSFVMWVAIPILTLSGVCMWKQGAIMKALRKKTSAPQNNH